MTEFVEVKIDDLSGAALDWAVAQIEDDELDVVWKACGSEFIGFGTIGSSPEFACLRLPAAVTKYAATKLYSPSTDWGQGGPLLDKNPWALPYRATARHHLGKYEACTPGGFPHNGSTPLLAACRAIVAAEFGGTVSVPKELLPC